MTERRRPGPDTPSDALRAVTVDLWHTLIAADPRSRARVEAARQRAWVDPLVASGLGPEEADAAVRRMRRASERLQSTGVSVPMARQAAILREACGVRVPPEVAAATIAEAVRAAEVRPAPGALAALAALRRAGLRLALVSNILAEPPGPMRELLEREGLRPSFEAVYLSCEQRFAKPGPEPFRAAVAALGVRPEAALHIGDHSDDVVGARRAGLPVLRYTGLLANYPREPPEKLALIPSGVPNVARWREIVVGLPTLLERARAAAAAGRPAVRRARSARA